MSAVVIPKGPITLAGLLHKPADSNSDNDNSNSNSSSSNNNNNTMKGPAIVIVHPGGGVKEQVANVYSRKLSLEGFTTLCFDASHQGESGGDQRFLEDPAVRVSDVWAAVDYLERVDTVDADSIGVLGICSGGGYAVAAAKADHRIRAVATVSLVNIGDSARKGWDGRGDPSKHVETLRGVAAQIAAENAGAQVAAAPYVPAAAGPNTPNDLRESSDYYLTPRGNHPRAPNKMLFKSFPRVLTFDAFHLADLYLTQPVLLIAGERAGSLWHTERLYDALAGRPKKVIVPGATHIDLFDKEPAIAPAMKEIAEFMKANLI